MSPAADRVLLTRARLPSRADGELSDILVEDGIVTAIAVHGSMEQTGVVDDLNGFLVLPGLVELHAHLDKALTADVVPNPSGDLLGAIDAWIAAEERGVFDFDSMVERATAALLRLVAHGVTAVRSHVNVGASDPTHVHLRAVLEAKKRLGQAIDLHIVALMHSPLAGSDGHPNRLALAQVLELGVDFVGGCPSLEPDGPAMIEIALAAAREAGVGVDLHVDETLDPSMLTLRDLCRQVEENPIDAPVAASHCVSLSMQSPSVQEDIARAAGRAGVDIIALPHTNLFLQGREFSSAMPRGITPVDLLRQHGVRVGAGGDNVQDPFNPVGRSDPLETAGLMIMAAHQLPGPALDLVTTSARAVMGLPSGGPHIGSVADLMAIDARNERQAIADAPLARRTYRRGHLTAVTQVQTSFTDRQTESKW